ncbi:hypothetical protein BKA62DRAFT_698271 [Auriculariales sp. MPI-PUGE-AT-0066]|nr:hypothetical protein BKA62DRAFT_698271 [Auriculariales sp. MPI-PUGE-AT-0066]
MSRSPSPTQSSYSHYDEDTGEYAGTSGPGGGGGQTVCLWGDACGEQFKSADELGDHVNLVHVVEDRPKYTCKWRTCERRGMPQASKFALIVHCRSHTGQRPFVCDQGDCAKAFTRADALHKHQRAHHGMDIPMPGRGGNRKRKYTTRDQEAKQAQQQLQQQRGADDVPIGSPTLVSRSAVPLQQPPAHDRRDGPSPARQHSHQHHHHHHHQSQSQSQQPAHHKREHAHTHAPRMPPEEALQISRKYPDIGPWKAAYLIEKSKSRWIKRERDSLFDELDRYQREEGTAYYDKERALDEVLRANFGSAASELLSTMSPHGPSA